MRFSHRAARCCRVGLLLSMLQAAAAVAQPPAVGEYVELESRAVQAAAKQAAPWVVRIETLGGLEAVGGRLVTQGPTTGVVISPDGYIVSSAFNFVQLPSAILVTLPGGDRRPAKLVARDRSRMLVLLHIKTKPNEKLPTPVIVDRKKLQVGQTAIALGRTYPGDLPSISGGIISARNRIWGRAVQTDAKISPANYGGPLVDLEGRLIGILVPMSPQKQTELAGSEWYDSGIGFAVPLSDLQPLFDQWKQGNDLFPGKLGISLKGTNVFADPAIVAAVAPKSPAREAGLKAKDRIVEIDGQAITRQAELKHALGPRYAGEVVHLVVERGDDKKRFTFDVKLAEKIEPYTHPFLGILPVLPKDDRDGIVVRFVYPESPAAKAGIKPGDRLVRLGDTTTKTLDDALEALLPFEPGSEIAVEIDRAGKPVRMTVKLAELPRSVPENVPAVKPPAGEAAESATGVIEVKVPEEPNECFGLVPTSYRPDMPHGLLVWLGHPSGEFKKDEWIEAWKPIADANHLIILAPQPADPKRWSPTDAEYLAKAVEELRRNYSVDAHRIVVGGDRSGGMLAYIAAFLRRDLFHGVVAFNAPYPARSPLPANEPAQRLAVYSIHTKESRSAARIEQLTKILQTAKYPVTVEAVPAKTLDRPLRDQIARWIDVMVRF